MINKLKIDSAITVTHRNGTEKRDTVIPHETEIITQPVSGIKDLAKTSYSPVGQCIYCGSRDDLRREHVIPYGLSGTLVLPDATCAACANVTAGFERKVLRGPMRPVRLLRKLRSRSGHAGAARDATLRVVKSGIETTVTVPLTEFPILLPFPVFAAPRKLTAEAGTGIVLTGVMTVLYGARPEELARKLGAQRLVFDSVPHEPVAFARMLAKIAYGFAWGEGALAKLSAPCPVLPAILGKTDDIGTWVGTLTGPVMKYPGLLHRLSLHEQGSLLVAAVQLFADSETPSYGVILGERMA